MAAADSLIQRDGPVAAPFDIVVPASTDIVPLACSATFDGSGASAPFVPVLEFLAQNGAVVARCPLDTTIAVGGSADVSWFPWRRVRAATPAPSPNPLGTLFAWFDFSDAATITLDGSSRISAIADKTGNGHDAGQGTAGNRPAQSTVNGLSAGLFDSARPDALVSGPWSDSLSQPFTIAVVWTQDIAASANYFPGPIGGSPSPGPPVMFENELNNLVVMQQGNTSIQVLKAAPFTQQLMVGIYNGGSSSFRINSVATAGAVDTITVTDLALGAAHWPARPPLVEQMKGKLCEVLVYEDGLSASQLAAVESYLKAKWATP